MYLVKLEFYGGLKRKRAWTGGRWDQAAFARELGVSQAQLSRYEKGKSEMGADVVLRISRKFGKSMECWCGGRMRVGVLSSGMAF